MTSYSNELEGGERRSSCPVAFLQKKKEGGINLRWGKESERVLQMMLATTVPVIISIDARREGEKNWSGSRGEKNHVG